MDDLLDRKLPVDALGVDRWIEGDAADAHGLPGRP
jgi:hypothetical protein